MEKPKVKCPISGCHNFINRNNVCSNHYMRFWKYGSYDLPEGHYGRANQKNLPKGISYNCRIHGYLKEEDCVNRGKSMDHEKRIVKWWCKKCQKNSHTKRLYKIDEKKYIEMLKEQNNSCFICKKEEKVRDKRNNKLKMLSIDHCHKTGIVRKLLCNRCNNLIGMGEESVSLFQSIIQYLSTTWC